MAYVIEYISWRCADVNTIPNLSAADVHLVTFHLPCTPHSCVHPFDCISPHCALLRVAILSTLTAHHAPEGWFEPVFGVLNAYIALGMSPPLSVSYFCHTHPTITLCLLSSFFWAAAPVSMHCSASSGPRDLPCLERLFESRARRGPRNRQCCVQRHVIAIAHVHSHCFFRTYSISHASLTKFLFFSYIGSSQQHRWNTCNE